MFLQVAELIALVSFLWIFAKMQVEQNDKFDKRLDAIELKIAVLIESEKFRSDYALEAFERLEEKFNYLKAKLQSDNFRPENKT